MNGGDNRSRRSLALTVSVGKRSERDLERRGCAPNVEAHRREAFLQVVDRDAFRRCFG